MGRCFIQIVTGPAGSGKSTYCNAIQQHCSTLGKLRKRNVHVGNLDPAAENFQYDVAFDIRDLITVEDVMEEMGLGPNGALIFCMEYLLVNMDWLEGEMDKFDDDEYLILDCPGQIELYTHAPIMKRVIDQMSMWGHAGRMASVFIVDATFVCDAPKFISGSLLSLSAMIAMELPHVNILSKADLVDEARLEHILDVESATVLWQREEYNSSLQEEANLSNDDAINQERRVQARMRRKKQNRLTQAICSLLDDYSMVSFIPLNIQDEESLDHVLSYVDHTIQYGEDLEVRGAEEDDFVGASEFE
jgi:GPN-loop GTPase